MEDINNIVLAKIKEYAQSYFDAIIQTNTIDGKSSLKPGKYSAKDMLNNSYTSVFGQPYEYPDDEIFNEEITITVGTFECKFNYRDIFHILTKWETMMNTRKNKTVFEIGSTETISANEIDEVTAIVVVPKFNRLRALSGATKKNKKLCKLGGNWYCDAKRKTYDTEVFYEINGVKFSVSRVPWVDINKGVDWQKQWLPYPEDSIEQQVRIKAAYGNKFYFAVVKGIEAQQPATPQPESVGNTDNLPQPSKFAPQSPQIAPAVNDATPTRKRA